MLFCIKILIGFDNITIHYMHIQFLSCQKNWKGFTRMQNVYRDKHSTQLQEMVSHWFQPHMQQFVYIDTFCTFCTGVSCSWSHYFLHSLCTANVICINLLFYITLIFSLHMHVIMYFVKYLCFQFFSEYKLSFPR